MKESIFKNKKIYQINKYFFNENNGLLKDEYNISPYIDEYNELIKNISFDHNYKHIRVLCYILKNNLQQEDIKCSIDGCNNNTTVFNNKLNAVKFGKTCSKDCNKLYIKNKVNTEYVQNKTRETNLKKYGGHYSQTKIFKDKVKETNLQKFGKEYYSQTDECKLKTKDTNLQKYGANTYSQTDECKLKTKLTNLIKFGKENYSQTDECKQKSKETNLKKYGVENYSQTDEYLIKSKETNLKKYGVENYSQTDEYHIKLKKSSIKKFGKEYYSQTDEFKKRTKMCNTEHYTNIHFWNNKQFIEDNFLTKKKYFKLEYFMKFFNCSNTVPYKKLKELNIDYKKRQGVSEAEYIINDYIKSLNLETNQSDRKILNGKELDILVPEKNVAFEYCGLMFHSHGISDYSMFNNPKEDRYKHSKKYEETKEKGIHLYTIFENEFIELHKREIWFSMISNALGKSSKRIGARKTDLRIVNNKDKDKFLEANHMQGKLVSSINLGLYYKDELVSLMTFAYKDSKNKVYKLERFCNKKHHLIQGASSKLLKYFENNYDCNELISYANKRWSNGNLYKTLGFELYNESEPNYFYFKEDDITSLWSRVSFQKHKLKKKLELFDDSLSETQNMYNNGYRKIYDCGNYCFRKRY